MIERPDATTILGATKVTGKSNGWTYGGLTALTDREYGLVATADGQRAERLIEPFTSYNVARIQKDLRGGSTLGLHSTAVLREQDFDGYTGSMDYTLRWKQNKYNWNGQWSSTRSAVNGEMKNGFGGVTNLNYSSKHFGYLGHYDYFNATFKNSDLGFFGSRTNKTQVNGGFFVSNPDPWKQLRSINVSTADFTQYNGDWLPLDKSWFRRRRRTVPELLEFLPRHRPHVGTPTTISTRAAGRRSSSPARGSSMASSAPTRASASG